MIHDPAIFYDEVSGNYYTYSTGAICQKSKDLVHWQEIGKVVERPPQESVEWTGSEDIWAPDIVKVGKEYRLYCSNSSWGVRQSCIFLAVADCPEGPFEPKGCVLKTTEKFPQSVTNAIDANIIEDAKTGEQYMLYGSFWGGCHVLKLNKTTGFAEEEGISSDFSGCGWQGNCGRGYDRQGSAKGKQIPYHRREYRRCSGSPCGAVKGGI